MAPHKEIKKGYRATRAPPGMPPSTQAPPGTPPDSPNMPPLANSPALQDPSAALTVQDLGQLLLKLIDVIKSPGSTNAAEPEKPDTLEAKTEIEILRASALEFKTVNEVYVAIQARVQPS